MQPKISRFRAHMVLHEMTWDDVGAIMGIKREYAGIACRRESLGKEYRDKLLEAGFPEDCLPLEHTRQLCRYKNRSSYKEAQLSAPKQSIAEIA